jgi:hypothetical protein
MHNGEEKNFLPEFKSIVTHQPLDIPRAQN